MKTTRCREEDEAMASVTWTAVARNDGANVYVSGCGRFRLYPRRVTGKRARGRRAASFIMWDLIERTTGAVLDERMSFARAKLKANEIAASAMVTP